jgi:hypothetical protein
MDELMDFNDETMFAALMEGEAQIAAVDEEHLIMLSCLMVFTPTMMQSRGAEGRRLNDARANRGRGWKATEFSMPTTSPTTHCTTR